MSWLSLIALLPLLTEVSPETSAGDIVAIPESAEQEGNEQEQVEASPARRWRAPYLGAQLDLSSTYVFRGELQYASPVIPSLQPSLWLDFSHLVPGSLSFTLWGALAMADRRRVRREGTATELDIALSYERSVARGWLELGGGFLYYVYPGEEEVDGEKELVFALGVGNLPISIGLTTSLEVHPGFGVYFEPRLGWERIFGDFTVGMDLVLGAGVSRGEEGSLDHLTITAGVSHDVGRLAFGLNLSYTLRIAPPGLDFIERSLLYGAVSLSYNPPDDEE